MARESSKRSNKLIAEFSDGYASGWAIPVKECFKRELDIKYTQKTKNKQTYFEWTQGKYYCFSAGQILYSSKFAYKKWENFSEKSRFAIQIVEALPNRPPSIAENSFNNEIVNGYVRFVLYIFSEKSMDALPFVGYQLTQNEFVDALKSGEIDNEKLDYLCSFGQRQFL